MGTPAIGALAKMAIDSVLPFDTSSLPLEFVNESVRMVQSHVQSEGIRGTRARSKERVRIAREQITGSILFRPSPSELEDLLPYIMGAAGVAGVYDFGEALSEFQLMIDRVTKVFTYAGCKVGRAVFSGSQGQPLELRIDVEGETEAIGAAGGFPAISADTDTMFILSDCVLALGADTSAVQFRQFELTIDNVLDADRYMNSVTRAEIAATDRIVTLTLGMMYTADEVDLHDQAITGGTGTLTFTNGGQSIEFDFPNLKAEAQSPVVEGKGEIALPLNMTAYKSGSDGELTITLDATA